MAAGGDQSEGDPEEHRKEESRRGELDGQRHAIDHDLGHWAGRLQRLPEVTLQGDRKTGASAGFRILAAYIFSKDTPSGEPIGMTVPVGQLERDGAWQMWFVLPSRFTRDTLPPVTDPRIRIVEQPAERVALHRRSGRMDTADFDKEARRLEAAVREAGLAAVGPATLAVYNGPFVPGPFRRNEIQISIDPQGTPMCGEPSLGTD